MVARGADHVAAGNGLDACRVATRWRSTGSRCRCRRPDVAHVDQDTARTAGLYRKSGWLGSDLRRCPSCSHHFSETIADRDATSSRVASERYRCALKRPALALKRRPFALRRHPHVLRRPLCAFRRHMPCNALMAFRENAPESRRKKKSMNQSNGPARGLPDVRDWSGGRTWAQRRFCAPGRATYLLVRHKIVGTPQSIAGPGPARLLDAAIETRPELIEPDVSAPRRSLPVAAAPSAVRPPTGPERPPLPVAGSRRRDRISTRHPGDRLFLRPSDLDAFRTVGPEIAVPNLTSCFYDGIRTRLSMTCENFPSEESSVQTVITPLSEEADQ